mmetsp:Transcript_1268/g.1896  ORF Transcript_1268/g.1896 Transcript_1268/m.1896 type:complete len:251 (+) Transcript_1268:70-822(+)
MGKNQSKIKEKSLSLYKSLPEDWPWVWGIRDAECLDWKLGLSQHELKAQASRQSILPVPITDDVVYLGNARSVESIPRLEAHGITAVLNMAGPHALRRETIKGYKKHGIEYKQINAEDEIDYNLLQNDWEEACEFIRATTANGKGKCVVHCVAGMNRSALIVSAYHMTTTRTPVLETVKHVRKQRGNVALCNEGFQQQLVAMARVENILGAAPGAEGSIVDEVPPPAASDWIFNVMTRRRQNPLDQLSRR